MGLGLGITSTSLFHQNVRKTKEKLGKTKNLSVSKEILKKQLAYNVNLLL